jgi:hypothetical protein
MQESAAFLFLAIAATVYVHSLPAAEAELDANNWEQSLRAAQQAAHKDELDRARQLLMTEIEN